MHDPSTFERHHALAMIEAAQREGRTENEIVALVETHFRRGAARVDQRESPPGIVRRLVGGPAARRAA